MPRSDCRLPFDGLGRVRAVLLAATAGCCLLAPALVVPALAQQTQTQSQTQTQPQRQPQPQAQPQQQQRPPAQQQQRPAQTQQQQRPQAQPPAAQPPAPRPAPAAPQPQLVGEYGDWFAFTLAEPQGRVCFMASVPKTSAPATPKRESARMSVSHRPAEKLLDGVGVTMGVPLRAGSEVSVDVGGTKFAFFAEGDTAWPADEDTDRKVSEALRKGARVVVTATTDRNVRITDTYGLSGSSRAYEEMSKACNVRR